MVKCGRGSRRRYALRPARLTFPVPALWPATGVSDRAIYFRKTGRRQTEDFGLNALSDRHRRFAVDYLTQNVDVSVTSGTITTRYFQFA